MGCGCRVAAGADGWGQPWEYCCHGCAHGQGHDDGCGRVAAGEGGLGGAGDAELALAMQVEELHAQRYYDHQRQQMQQVWQHQQLQQQTQQDKLWDPLWGELILAPQLSKRFTQHMCFSCCPCALVGCSDSGQKAWGRFLLSWSWILAIVQVAALIGAIVYSGGIMPLAENPMLGPHYHYLDKLGAKNTAKMLQRNEWWRLLTPVMLHAGWLHLVGNLAVQLRTGAMLEAMWGHTAWLLIYAFSGALGVLASCVAQPNSLGVGSSGALCGLLGAWGMFILITWNQTSPVDIKMRNAQTFSVAISVAVIVGLSFLPLMDLFAHVGGILGGAALAMLLFAGRLQHSGWRRGVYVTGAIMMASLVSVAFSLLFLRTEPSDSLLSLEVPPRSRL